MELNSGIWFFVTISLDVDYSPSIKVMNYFNKKFSPLYMVQEKGESGKLHVHSVGLTTARQDNIKRGISKLLMDDGYVVDPKFSVDVVPEPNANWRIGYLQKEINHKILSSQGLLQATLERSKVDYDAKPKRVRTENRGKALSMEALAAQCIDAGCSDELSIIEFFRICQADGRLSFTLYHKLNCKKFVHYVTKSFDDLKI